MFLKWKSHDTVTISSSKLHTFLVCVVVFLNCVVFLFLFCILESPNKFFTAMTSWRFFSQKNPDKLYFVFLFFFWMRVAGVTSKFFVNAPTDGWITKSVYSLHLWTWFLIFFEEKNQDTNACIHENFSSTDVDAWWRISNFLKSAILAFLLI